MGALVRSFGRRSAVEGKLQGQSSVDSEGDNATDLVRTLAHAHPLQHCAGEADRLRPRQDGPARHGRGGQTRLDSLTGTLDTQATEEGVILRYNASRRVPAR